MALVQSQIKERLNRGSRHFVIRALEIPVSGAISPGQGHHASPCVLQKATFLSLVLAGPSCVWQRESVSDLIFSGAGV